MMEQPTLRQLLDAGVHFGHKTSRWHPKMSSYIFIAKSGVHVINLEKTAELLKDATNAMAEMARNGKILVFVGTKKQSQEIIKTAAIESGMPYVNERWLGGTLTNFDVIKASVKKFKKLRDQIETEDSAFSKKELSRLKKQVVRDEKLLGGLAGLDRRPDALILFGSHDEKNALHEAKNLNLPVFAIVDTNADPTLIDYPIPANDDATKSIKLFADLFANVIKTNRPEAAVKKDEKQNSAK